MYFLYHILDAVSDYTDSTSIDLKVHTQNIAILRGRDGRDGLKGEKGDPGTPGNGGLVFTRWGKNSCPETDNTELIYEGVTLGSSFNSTGGGANYMCISSAPDYMNTGSVTYFTSLGTARYKGATNLDVENKAAVCAVCYTSSRSAKLMIPGKINCPSKWTKEYSGFVMSDFYGHKHNSVFECIDKDMDGVTSDDSSAGDSARLYHVATNKCTSDLPCPPYIKYKPITCVVCTK